MIPTSWRQRRRVTAQRGATAVEYGLLMAASVGGSIPLIDSIEDGTPAGETVCSHLVHHTPASGTYNVSDSFEFEFTVFGWIQDPLALDYTDNEFGMEGVVYWTGEPWRGIEPNPPSVYDSVVQTSSDTIEVYFTTGDASVDQICVFSDCSTVG